MNVRSITTSVMLFRDAEYLSGRILSSQTIGVEFSSKIIKIGTGPRRKRIKLQLWDTAGTERFRSVSRSYYRGAAGAILVYDLASYTSFSALPTFLNDARALASPNLTLVLAGNKFDLTSDQHHTNDLTSDQHAPPTPTTPSSRQATFATGSGGGDRSTSRYSTHQTATTSTDGRQVSTSVASGWASGNDIPVSVEVSAYDGTGVEELFSMLARMILTKLELGEIDPDDPMSGIQYGDAGWGGEDGASVKSGTTTNNEEGGLARKRRKGRGRSGTAGWGAGMREWEAVFRLDGSGRRRRTGCC